MGSNMAKNNFLVELTFNPITLPLPPENVRTSVFLCFQGVEKVCIGNEWDNSASHNK